MHNNFYKCNRKINKQIICKFCNLKKCKCFARKINEFTLSFTAFDFHNIDGTGPDIILTNLFNIPNSVLRGHTLTDENILILNSITPDNFIVSKEITVKINSFLYEDSIGNLQFSIIFNAFNSNTNIITANSDPIIITDNITVSNGKIGDIFINTVKFIPNDNVTANMMFLLNIKLESSDNISAAVSSVNISQ